MPETELAVALQILSTQFGHFADAQQAAVAEFAVARLDLQRQREEDAKRHRRNERRQVVGVVAIVVLALFAFQERRIARSQADLTRVVLECTTPDNPSASRVSDRVHECYDNGERQQAAAVKEIVDALTTTTTTIPRG